MRQGVRRAAHAVGGSKRPRTIAQESPDFKTLSSVSCSKGSKPQLEILLGNSFLRQSKSALRIYTIFLDTVVGCDSSVHLGRRFEIRGLLRSSLRSESP